MSLLQSRFDELLPLHDMEVKLARAALGAHGRLDARDEATLRYALSLARLWLVRAPDGRDVAVAGALRAFRARLHAILLPLLGKERISFPAPHLLAEAARAVHPLARAALDELERTLGHRLPAAALDREIRERHLVLVLGGGGGTGYVHLAAFALLESAGLHPSLIAGSSMGGILGLFRAREKRFDLARIPEILGELTYRKIFRLTPQPSRYGMPGALGMRLREAVGHWFLHPDGSPLRLSELAIPLLVTVTGIRRGRLPRPLEEYERLVRITDPDPSRWGIHLLAANMRGIVAAFTELTQVPDLAQRIVFGASAETRQADALDAVGFSAAVPGVLHYDVQRDDPRMHELLTGLLGRHDLLRLCDGGVVDNVPARSAWRFVQRSGIPGSGSRNTVTLALDCFAPRLRTPIWLPLQRIAATAVQHARPYAHVYHPFRSTLSPLQILPSPRALEQIVRSAKEELLGELPVLQRLLDPIPAL